MERKLGEIFNYKDPIKGSNVTLRVKKNVDDWKTAGRCCPGCYFDHNGCYIRDRSILGDCSPVSRTDSNDVIFEQVKEEDNMRSVFMENPFEGWKEIWINGAFFGVPALGPFRLTTATWTEETGGLFFLEPLGGDVRLTVKRNLMFPTKEEAAKASGIKEKQCSEPCQEVVRLIRNTKKVLNNSLDELTHVSEHLSDTD